MKNRSRNDIRRRELQLLRRLHRQRPRLHDVRYVVSGKLAAMRLIRTAILGSMSEECHNAVRFGIS